MKKYEIPIYQVMLVKDNHVTMDSIALTSASAAQKILKEYLSDTDRENFCILLLNTRGNIIGINTVAVGTLDASIVHPREIFKPAILSNCSSIILCHNHPSGDPSPSPNDFEVTKRLKEAGVIMGISIRDHIILGDDTYYSFKEKDIL